MNERGDKFSTEQHSIWVGYLDCQKYLWMSICVAFQDKSTKWKWRSFQVFFCHRKPIERSVTNTDRICISRNERILFFQKSEEKSKHKNISLYFKKKNSSPYILWPKLRNKPLFVYKAPVLYKLWTYCFSW